MEAPDVQLAALARAFCPYLVAVACAPPPPPAPPADDAAPAPAPPRRATCSRAEALAMLAASRAVCRGWRAAATTALAALTSLAPRDGLALSRPDLFPGVRTLCLSRLQRNVAFPCALPGEAPAGAAQAAPEDAAAPGDDAEIAPADDDAKDDGGDEPAPPAPAAAAPVEDEAEEEAVRRCAPPAAHQASFVRREA
jgi:DNA polymerase-3 subunit gamma/tau